MENSCKEASTPPVPLWFMISFWIGMILFGLSPLLIVGLIMK